VLIEGKALIRRMRTGRPACGGLKRIRIGGVVLGNLPVWGNGIWGASRLSETTYRSKLARDEPEEEA
jgi:16S rRNA U516 pseudouridylate synthase RsuA-like enzyme